SKNGATHNSNPAQWALYQHCQPQGEWQLNQNLEERVNKGVSNRLEKDGVFEHPRVISKPDVGETVRIQKTVFVKAIPDCSQGGQRLEEKQPNKGGREEQGDE